MLTFIPVLIIAQEPESFCNCAAEGCELFASKTEITNLYEQQFDIIVTISKDGTGPIRKEVYGKLFPGVPIVQGNIKDIIEALKDRSNILGRSINVLIDGHGEPGRQQIGKEYISHRNSLEASLQQQFTRELQGKIFNLYLLGCDVASGNSGQEFISKLSGELGAKRVHAFTGRVQGQKVPRNGIFLLEGRKKVYPPIPVISELGLIALALLLTVTAVWVLRKRRGRVAV